MSVILYGCTSCTWRKSLMGITQRCYMLFWTNHGSSTPQNNSCKATYLSSHKPSKEDEQDILGQTHEWMSFMILLLDSHTWSYQCLPTSKTDIHQFSEKTGCHLEDLPRAMTDRNEEWKRVKAILAAAAADDDDDDDASIEFKIFYFEKRCNFFFTVFQCCKILL